MGKYDDFFNDWDVPNMGGYTKEEFLRCNNFCRLFPLKENVDYYSNFILNPEIENIVLWNLIKDGKIE